MNVFSNQPSVVSADRRAFGKTLEKQQIMKDTITENSGNSAGQVSSITILNELDIQLKVMNDKIDNVLNLLNLYMEFEEVVRSFILEDNPSLEKQLEAIKECKADIEPESITDDLENLVENAVYLMEQLKTKSL